MFFAIYLVAIVIVASTCLCISTYTTESLTFVYSEFSSVSWGWGESCRYIGFAVKNIGVTGVTFVNMQVNHTFIFPKSVGFETTDPGETMPWGFPYDWSSGEKYTITVITTRGGAFSFTKTARPYETLMEIENVVWNSADNTTSITVKSTSEYTRKIVGLHIFQRSNWLLPVTDSTDLGTGKVLYTNQTATIVLTWPNQFAPSWTSGETYAFRIMPEFGVGRDFNSTAPS